MARKGKVVPVVVKDPTGWIIDNEFAHFVLMHTNEIVSHLDKLTPRTGAGSHECQYLGLTKGPGFRLVAMFR